jgi:hypothetical protein
MSCSDVREAVVEYAKDQLMNLKPGFALTMTITRGTSEDFFVRTATVELSDGIVPQTGKLFYNEQLIT